MASNVETPTLEADAPDSKGDKSPVNQSEALTAPMESGSIAFGKTGKGLKDDSSSNDASSPSPAAPALAHPLPENESDYSFSMRLSTRVARRPCLFLWIALLGSIGLAAIGMIVGEFSVSANTDGWQSRGTLIADREAQVGLTRFYGTKLFFAEDEDAAWEDMLNNVQPGLTAEQMEDGESDEDEGEGGERLRDGGRRLSKERRKMAHLSWSEALVPDVESVFEEEAKTAAENKPQGEERRRLPFVFTPELKRRMQDRNSSQASQCSAEFYASQNATSESRLWPVWRDKSGAGSLMSGQAITEMCKAEENTQKLLEDNGLCFGCDGDSTNCHHPYSLVLYARLRVTDGFDLSCEQLGQSWSPIQSDIEAEWKQCAKDIVANPTGDLPSTCFMGFAPGLIDVNFAATDTTRLGFSSSIFATRESDVDELYDRLDDYDRAGGTIEGAYDTQFEDFVITVVDATINRDMLLALGSALIIAVAILVHTRSTFVTVIGLLQIILSFPLAFFVYRLVAQLDFFPFLNFIGVFVLFAIGADDIFVAVDKWKNARLAYPDASTEQIAAVALPDAANAMFLTTLTTAVAFFATAICPVAPIRMFAVFLGLLVLFDYMLNVLLVFPALCIYDRTNMSDPNCCTRCCVSGRCKKPAEEVVDHNPTNEEQSVLIRRVLLAYYRVLHKIRWPLMVACAVGLGISAYVAATLTLPTNSDVRLLNSDYQQELNWEWRQELLSSSLESANGSSAFWIWGVKPADTGNKNNPDSWTQLKLDPNFDAAPQDAQRWLVDFCPTLNQQEFVKPDAEKTCAINEFDAWLVENSKADSPDEVYSSNCAGASGLPMPSESFDACFIAWSKLVVDTTVLSWNGKVKILRIPYTSRVRFDNPFEVLDKEWKLANAWKDSINAQAPPTTNNGYFSSRTFWWYDTNAQMLRTAYSSAAIALAAAFLVVLVSSRSFVLTIFATVAVGYVLLSVTATLVGFGWTLGFLESICFAILIGLAVDFVIHFGHAYSSLLGNAPRIDRTKYALVTMGPSILAAAFTTIVSALIMLGTVITFFQKFAFVLFFTVIQASIASFIVFLVLCDCIGPSNPTALVDKCTEKMQGKKQDDVPEE